MDYTYSLYIHSNKLPRIGLYFSLSEDELIKIQKDQETQKLLTLKLNACYFSNFEYSQLLKLLSVKNSVVRSHFSMEEMLNNKRIKESEFLNFKKVDDAYLHIKGDTCVFVSKSLMRAGFYWNSMSTGNLIKALNPSVTLRNDFGSCYITSGEYRGNFGEFLSYSKADSMGLVEFSPGNIKRVAIENILRDDYIGVLENKKWKRRLQYLRISAESLSSVEESKYALVTYGELVGEVIYFDQEIQQSEDEALVYLLNQIDDEMTFSVKKDALLFSDRLFFTNGYYTYEDI